jgi:hypothetical protein
MKTGVLFQLQALVSSFGIQRLFFLNKGRFKANGKNVVGLGNVLGGIQSLLLCGCRNANFDDTFKTKSLSTLDLLGSHRCWSFSANPKWMAVHAAQGECACQII